MTKEELKKRILNEMVKKEPTYKEKLQELLYDPEEEERIETRFILDEIYKDRTVLVRDGRKTLPNYAISLDVTKYCVATCSNCDKDQPVEIIVITRL